jgi:hypothetical protein
MEGRRIPTVADPLLRYSCVSWHASASPRPLPPAAMLGAEALELGMSS